MANLILSNMGLCTEKRQTIRNTLAYLADLFFDFKCWILISGEKGWASILGCYGQNLKVPFYFEGKKNTGGSMSITTPTPFIHSFIHFLLLILLGLAGTLEPISASWGEGGVHPRQLTNSSQG